MKRKFSKNTCDALIFSEVAGLKPEILLKNDLLTAWKYPDTEFFPKFELNTENTDQKKPRSWTFFTQYLQMYFSNILRRFFLTHYHFQQI